MRTIAMFAYNRPIHTQKALDALANNPGAGQSRLVIFSDGPKDEQSRPLVNHVRRICDGVHGFREVQMVARDYNMGLADNIIAGLTDLFQTEDALIVLEDDLIVSPGFLLFMNRAIDFYKDCNVFSVCGYTPPDIVPQSYAFSTYLAPRIGSWGWATWRNRWEMADWHVHHFNQFIHSDDEIKAFNKAGNDLTPMLMKQKIGKNNSWAVRFAYAGFCQKMPTVYPAKSLVANLGVDGSGTHMRRSKRYYSALTDYLDTESFCSDAYIDESIIQNFKQFYDTSVFRQFMNYLLLKKIRRQWPLSL
ncbi:glycosyltransferase family protein [Alkaliflexus imshenetskii]|uniref:glycosyltransferase n=1 Tax=Alkaliflexus imshenetskii TaxID=286730 RepID=UPI0004ACC4A7|nr:glycosyltransferase [Alkaliflexus imshenetskii]